MTAVESDERQRFSPNVTRIGWKDDDLDLDLSGQTHF